MSSQDSRTARQNLAAQRDAVVTKHASCSLPAPSVCSASLEIPKSRAWQAAHRLIWTVQLFISCVNRPNRVNRVRQRRALKRLRNSSLAAQIFYPNLLWELTKDQQHLAPSQQVHSTKVGAMRGKSCVICIGLCKDTASVLKDACR